MWMVVLGVALLAMKLLEKGPAAQLDWMWVLAPFFLALAWWKFSDAVGLTSRKAMERDAKRKQERQRKQIEALGLGPRSRKNSK